MSLVSNPNSVLNEFQSFQSYNGNTPFSSQRWRYFIENTGSGELEREFIQYGSSTDFSEIANFKEINATGDKNYKFETAEQFAVPSENDVLLTLNFKIDRSLEAGEKMVIGLGNPDMENNMANASGWFLEFEPSLADNECYLGIYKNGSVVNRGGSRDLVELSNPVTQETQASMVVRSGTLSSAFVFETFTESLAKGFTDERVAKVIAGSGGGPEKLSFPISYNIRGGGITLQIDNTSIKKKDETSRTRRQKAYYLTESIGTENVWFPTKAFRIDPNRREIPVEILNINPKGYTNQDVEFMQIGFFAFHPSNVSFSGGGSWDTSPGTTENNDILQVRDDVSQIADSTGTLTASPSDIGGIQLKQETLGATKDKLQEGVSNSQRTQDPQSFPADDIGIFAVNIPSSGGTASFNPVFDQKW